ncbi:hypothetical protein C8R46DRAFT_1084697 [Mycena filopes]|nr:hypothetical protein C8R46DRAFT_1084697 [Mycena filopes]
MQLVEGIATVFAFRTLPTTVLALFLYAVVFGAVLWGDAVPRVPKDQKGLDLAQAYADLHHIAGRPHPFLSHANDIVRAYIVDRVRNITAGVAHIEVDEDLVSTASFPPWGGGPYAVYNEGTNILVKINGTEPEYTSGGGVLFSAHYDSVSTASGVTDDGMGVATLIQLVQYFTANRPKRTAVFNINNAEEVGLIGAFTFLVHPWSKLVDSFLNLEGASSGGRPLLFRGTSTPAMRSFHVPHPHGNVLSSDAFARGVIRSGTDYTVYTGAGMEGLDLAFYRGRSKYHTKYDAIPYTTAQQRALWAMMESAKSSGISLLNDDRTHGPGSPPVYFDLFGIWLVLLSMNTLFISNVVLLVVGPILLLTLACFDAAIAYGRNQHQNGHVPEHRDSMLRQFWTWFVEFGWLKSVWVWAKFWVAVLVTLGLQGVLMYGYAYLNPFIIHSAPTLVVISSFTLTYLSLVFIITPSSKHLPERQKHVMFLQTYIFTWILLVVSTVAVDSGIGGLYFVTAWNAAVFIACVVGSIENMLGAQGSYDAPHRFLRRARYDAIPEGEPSSQAAEAEVEATEATPLIQPQLSSSPRTRDESGAIGWWILQLALAVSVPVTLVAHITILMIGATAQSLIDGMRPIGAYLAVSILVLMLVLPVVPFTFKIHSAVAYVFIVIFVLSTAYSMLAFPFSQADPLKVYFEQTVDLGNITAPLSAITTATTSLKGVPYFMKDLVIPQLPSAIGQELNCSSQAFLPGLESCDWQSTLLPTPGSYPLGAPGPWPHSEAAAPATRRASDWMTVNLSRLKLTPGNSARFTISATNTRGCKLNFDNQRIDRWKVHDVKLGRTAEWDTQEGGISSLRLFSRTWARAFVVDVAWDGDAGLEGRVSCDWEEYESGSVGVDTTARMPAFEETLAFLPAWVAVTQGKALVSATGTFYLG